jgi:hypothetical protein
VLGAVFGAVRVLGGAKQTSKGLAWCRVLSKDKVRVLCGAKQTSKGLVQKFGVLFGCQAR